MSEKTPLLSVDGVSLEFGGLRALNSVSCEVATASVVGIIGPNGAGKTSLLNCISGFYRPQHGKIRLGDTDILGLSPVTLARLGIARTFQGVQLIGEATVLDNVLLGRHVVGRTSVISGMLYIGRARAKELSHLQFAESVLDRIGIRHLSRTRVSDLPFGVQRLVEIARAMAMEPRVLLLDEPTSGMNRSERDAIGKVIRQLREQEDVTEVIVEHDVRFISDICDRVVVLNFGQKIAEGDPAEVLADSRVVEAYVGTGLL